MKPTPDQIIAEAERLWRIQHPKANDTTLTAVKQTAALFGQARRNLSGVRS